MFLQLQELEKQLQRVAQQQAELKEQLPACNVFGVGVEGSMLWSCQPSRRCERARRKPAGACRWVLASSKMIVHVVTAAS